MSDILAFDEMSSEDLEHYGRLGMRWYQHRFGEQDGRAAYMDKGKKLIAKADAKQKKKANKAEAKGRKAQLRRDQATWLDAKGASDRRIRKAKRRAYKLSKKAFRMEKASQRQIKKIDKIVSKMDKLAPEYAGVGRDYCNQLLNQRTAR